MAWSYDPQKGAASLGSKSMQELATAYQGEKGSNIKFVRQPVDGYTTWLNTQLAGGTAPDIVLDQTAPQDGAKGLVIALDEYLERPNPYISGNKRWADSFRPGVLDILRQGGDGKIYSIAPDLTETTIFYNKDLFTQKGIEPPTTWSDWAGVAEAVRSANLEPLGCSEGLFQWWPLSLIGDMMMADLIPSLDAASPSDQRISPEEYARGIKAGKYDPAQGSYRDAWRVLQDWSKIWMKDWASPKAVESFLNGRVAMLWTHTGVFPTIQDSKVRKFELSSFYLPPLDKATTQYATDRQPKSVGGPGTPFSVTSTAAKAGRAEGAVDFLMYLTAPQNATKYVNESGAYVPAIVGAEPDPALASVMSTLERGRPDIAMFPYLTNEGNDQFTRLAQTDFTSNGSLDTFISKLAGINASSADAAAKANGWSI